MPFQPLQIEGGGGRVVTAPQLEMVNSRRGRNVESGKCRIESLTLGDYELQRRPSQPLKQGQLELELDSHVPDMTDRATEPPIESTFARWGDPVDDPIWTGRSWLGVGQFGEPGIDQAVEGPVHQRPPHREHPPHLGIGFKCFGDGEAVGRAIGEETEDGVFGERWLELRHGHESRVPD